MLRQGVRFSNNKSPIKIVGCKIEDEEYTQGLNKTGTFPPFQDSRLLFFYVRLVKSSDGAAMIMPSTPLISVVVVKVSWLRQFIFTCCAHI